MVHDARMDTTMNEHDVPPQGPPASPSAEPSQRPPPLASGEPPASGRRGYRRLYRAPSGMLGGVARGLAAYFDIDPVITRLLFLVALFSGIGLPAYLICWVVIPKARTWPAPGYTDDEVQTTGLGHLGQVTTGLLVIALAVLVGTGLDGVGEFVLPAVLLGFGVYLLNQRGADDAPAPAVPVEPAMDGQGAALPYGTPRGVAPAPTRLTATVLSILALGLGTALALQSAGVVELAMTGLAAAGLVIVAIGLLASIRLGPAPGLIPTGLALAMLMVGASAAAPFAAQMRAAEGWSFDGVDGRDAGAILGEQAHAPRELAQLEPKYEQVVGELRLDLSELDLEGQTREVELVVALGDLEVLLPPDVSAEVHGRVGLGEAEVFGQTGGVVEGGHIAEGPGKLIINFKVGIGEGTVRHDG